MAKATGTGAGYDAKRASNSASGMPTKLDIPGGMPSHKFLSHIESARWLKSFGSSLHDIAYAASKVETGSEFSKVSMEQVCSPSPVHLKSGTSGAKALTALIFSAVFSQNRPPARLSE